MVSKKVILIIIVVVVILLLAGLGVGLYFLLRPSSAPTGTTSGTTNSRPPNPTGATNSTPVNPTGATNATPAPTPPAPAPTPTPPPVNNPTSIISLIYNLDIGANLTLITQDNLSDYYTFNSVSHYQTYPVPANSLMIKSTSTFGDGNMVLPLAAEIPMDTAVANYYYKRTGDYLAIEVPRNWRNEGVLPNGLINYNQSKLVWPQKFNYINTANVVKANQITAGSAFPKKTLGTGQIYFYSTCYFNDSMAIPNSDIAQIVFHSHDGVGTNGNFVTPANEWNFDNNSVLNTANLFFFRFNLTSNKIEIIVPADWLQGNVDTGLINPHVNPQVSWSNLYLYTYTNNLNYRKVSLSTGPLASAKQAASYKVYRRYNLIPYTGFNSTNLYDLAINYTVNGISYKLFSNNVSVHGESAMAVFYYFINLSNNVLSIYFPITNRYGNGSNQNILINSNGSLNGNLEAWYYS